MKKQYLFGFIVIILAALAFTGCDFFGGGLEPGGGGGEDSQVKYDNLVINGKAESKDVQITFRTDRTYSSKATIMTPQSGDSYAISFDGTTISSGTITVNGAAVTFKPSSGTSFEAILTTVNNNSILTFPDGIPKSATDVITGYINNNTTPVNPTFTSDLTLDTSGTLKVSVSDSSGVSYHWYKNTEDKYNGTFVQTTTTGSYTPTNTTTTYYYVCVTNNTGGYLKSVKVAVTGTGGVNNTPENIGNILGPDTEGSLWSSVGTTITIIGAARVQSNFEIPKNTVVRVGTVGTNASLSIPETFSGTVNGTLVIEGGSTLKADGVLVVASGALFNIHADKTVNDSGDDGILSGKGTITLNGGMYLPDLDKYNLSSFSGNIDVNKNSELFLVGSKDGVSGTVYSSFIGKADSQSLISTGSTPIAYGSKGSDFVVDEGYITLSPRNVGSKTIGQMKLSGSGKATVMGQPENGGSNTTVTLSSPFLLDRNSTLMIGGGGSNKKAATLRINSAGTSGYLDMDANTTVILYTGSSIIADATGGVKGTVNIRKDSINGVTINPTGGTAWTNSASTSTP